MRKASSNNHTDDSLQLAAVSTYHAGVAQSASYRLLKKFTEKCISRHGITMMQWFIIGTIFDTKSDGIGVTQLSKAVDTNVPYITNTLNTLERKNIIVREAREHDNRLKVVRIHPDYLPEVPRIEADLRARMRETIYVSVSPVELKTYLTVLHKLSRLTI